MGYRWDIGGTLVKPPTVLSDMYLPGGSVIYIELIILDIAICYI